MCRVTVEEDLKQVCCSIVFPGDRDWWDLFGLEEVGNEREGTGGLVDV